MEDVKGNILVAPINWGLGHATRCIPIIKALEQNGFKPFLASDGDALELLRREFPHLPSLELPSYDIEYPKKASGFRWKMLKGMPHMIEAVVAEKKIIKKWVKQYQLDGIISDNRFGVQSKKIPSIFITHQLNVLSGNTTWLSGKLHRMIIDRFDECWIPDVETFPNLSGKLGHIENPGENIHYIGPLSRFEKEDLPLKYDLSVILSGPEPQRGMLEAQLLAELGNYPGKILFVRGVVEEPQQKSQTGRITIFNFMATDELQRALNQSKLILCRSGYTSIMDIAKLGKKAFFIPTPGQYEQEYLAKKMKREGLLPSAKQEKFRVENLLEADLYPGLPFPKTAIHWKNLFCLFEGKGELRA